MGQHVHVLVSLGPPQIVVPDLVGESMRAARISVVQRGLTVGDLMLVPWTGDPDVIVAQDPPPAAAEVRTPTVNLLVSGGEQTPAYLCPRFIGHPISQVRQVLESNGFKVGEITPVPTPDGTPGAILTQMPASGSKIGADAIFSFQVVQ
jgi:serine/threonine-protein kinase